MTDIDTTSATGEGGAALETVIAALAGLDTSGVRAPSHLPGWTRGHVLAHLDGVGNAYARQVEAAARGELVEVYDGGRAGRDAAIEQGAGRDPAAHRAALETVRERVSSAWPDAGSSAWDERVAYRDGTVRDVALAWWREACIHLVDLDVGVGQESWSTALCRHLLEFLADRLPAGEPVLLVPDDEDVRHAVDGPDVEVLEVHGALRDMVAWLAGRDPATAPSATRGTVRAQLPELGPWPSAPAR